MRNLILTTAMVMIAGTSGAMANNDTMLDRMKNTVTTESNKIAKRVDEVVSPTPSVNAQGLRAIDDIKIVNRSGKELGEVKETLIDSAGRVVAVKADFDGIRDLDDDVIIALDQMEFTNGRYVVSMSDDQLRALPVWRD